METTSNSSALDNLTQEYFDRVVQVEAEPALLHSRFAVPGMIEPGNGRLISFPRMHALPTVKSTLTEGVTPAPGTSTWSKVTGGVDQIGWLQYFSDLLTLSVDDRFMNMTAMAQGRQAGRSIDWRICQVLNSGTNVSRVNNRASRNLIVSGDKLTMTDIKKAVRDLENAEAVPFAEIGGRFVGFVHPDTKFDLTEDNYWKDRVKNNPAAEGLFEGYYIGDCFNVSWYSSTATKKFENEGDSGIDVYSTLIFGEGAYGVQDLQELEFIVKQLGSAGTADGLNQRSSMGWKTAFGSKILWDQYLKRIEHAVSQ